VTSEVAIPRHLAIIMDGNGRWAEQRGQHRNKGHEAGAESVRDITRACGELGVEVLTLYSFSTENWGRPEDEVQALMALLARYLTDEIGELMDMGVRLRAIGELHRLPDSVRLLLDQVSTATSQNDGLILQLALSYGSRAEIAAAVRSIARDVEAGAMEVDAIDEMTIAGRLYTGSLPDPDLVIRTSGEMRLSNFLLWQLAYAEILVTEVLWPDFRRPELEEALRVYGSRNRRFGKTRAQLGDAS